MRAGQGACDTVAQRMTDHDCRSRRPIGPGRCQGLDDSGHVACEVEKRLRGWPAAAPDAARVDGSGGIARSRQPGAERIKIRRPAPQRRDQHHKRSAALHAHVQLHRRRFFGKGHGPLLHLRD